MLFWYQVEFFGHFIHSGEFCALHSGDLSQLFFTSYFDRVHKELQIKQSSYPLKMFVFSLLIEWFIENIFPSTRQTVSTRIFIRTSRNSQSKMSSFRSCLSIWFQTIFATNFSISIYFVICLLWYASIYF